jgi:predicted GNAT family acetyltransferase
MPENSPDTSPEIDVVRNEQRHRYEALLDGEVAGFMTYRVGDGTIELVHTEVDDTFEGEGVGSTLVRDVLDGIRREGDRGVIPSCPFVAEWIERHPDYADLVVKA